MISPREYHRIQRDSHLIARLAEHYRKQFVTLSENPAADEHAFRLCAEAIDALLANQQKLAGSLAAMIEPQGRPKLQSAA